MVYLFLLFIQHKFYVFFNCFVQTLEALIISSISQQVAHFDVDLCFFVVNVNTLSVLYSLKINGVFRNLE